jgi:hypothetical protein
MGTPGGTGGGTFPVFWAFVWFEPVSDISDAEARCKAQIGGVALMASREANSRSQT